MSTSRPEFVIEMQCLAASAQYFVQPNWAVEATAPGKPASATYI